MLKVYIADTGGIDTSAAYPLSDYRRERVGCLRVPEKIRESIGAELLLNHAVKELFPAAVIPLDITCSGYGKPEISGGEFHFSLSHSNGRVLCAVSDSAVGADIQYISAFHDSVARRFFAADEREYILSRPDRDAAFTGIWCRKESYIKALGTGLATPLESFSVIGRSDIFYTVTGKHHIALCVPGGIDAAPEITEILH